VSETTVVPSACNSSGFARSSNVRAHWFPGLTRDAEGGVNDSYVRYYIFVAQAQTRIYPLTQEPIQLRGVRAPNRIVRSAAGVQLSRREIDETLIRYHEARGIGGAGLTILGDGRTHPSASGMFKLWESSIVPSLGRLADRCHAVGMLLFQQLTHQGALVVTDPWAPSSTRSPVTGLMCKEMTREMIGSVVDGFATSARNCEEAGLAGVEVHASHGFLLGAFLSELTNKRSDTYGGAFANRSRLVHEVLAAVRSAVSDDFVVGVRVSSTEGVPGGIPIEETIQLVEDLQFAGMIDFVNVSLGSFFSWDLMMGPTGTPHGYQLERSAQVTKVASVPTIVTGRITSIAEAESVLEASIADMVSMVRATIADPDLPRKSWAGAEDTVRPCIGCNDCLVALNREKRLRCTVNPEIGHEGDLWKPADRAKRVLVIGSGPAGLEFARTAARRGHRVTVVERAVNLGGMVEFARKAPTREEYGAAVDWSSQELARLGVEVEFGVDCTAETVATRDPDIAVVATGACARGALSGAWDLANDLDVLRGHRPAKAGMPVVVCDTVGSHRSLAVLELLAMEGFPVTVATSSAELLAGLKPTLERDSALRRLTGMGVSHLPNTVLAAPSPDGATLLCRTDRRPTFVEAGLVVVVEPVGPDSALVVGLADWTGEVIVIGDAMDVRGMGAAARDGFEAARVI
jgi:2,4-dienoyl-CoA reductase-like NADH-dependent reductase (Old Yellow Enzyme family)